MKVCFNFSDSLILQLYIVVRRTSFYKRLSSASHSGLGYLFGEPFLFLFQSTTCFKYLAYLVFLEITTMNSTTCFQMLCLFTILRHSNYQLFLWWGLCADVSFEVTSLADTAKKSHNGHYCVKIKLTVKL